MAIDSVVELSLEWVEEAEGLLQTSDVPSSLRAQNSLQSEPVPASVLVPVFLQEAEWQVLYIRRVSNDRDRHSGQVAFPGGRRDPGDVDATAVALREAHEEIGLAPEDVEILHVLDDYHTSSNYLVTPVVAQVPWPYPYLAQPTEVDRIFSIPLKWLADSNNVELRERAFRPGEARSGAAIKVVYFDQYDGELLWGATARMSLSFLHALYEKRLSLV